MSTTQKSKTATLFIDYVPAELRENKRWEIIFYVINPYTEKLKRKAKRVKPLKSITERRKLGKRMVLAINNKLERGWNPFLNSNEAKGFITFFAACDLFLKRTLKEVANDDKRKDTYRSYKSFITNIKNYLIEIGEAEMFVIKFNDVIVRDFLDVVYYDRDNTARTRNNYLNFIKTFSEWLIKHKYISNNPTTRIELLPTKTKKREVIPDNLLADIFNALKTTDSSYYVLCLVCYYCLVRRTEMTKLRVRDVLIKNGVLYIEKEASKNKKSLPVTIPDALIPFLADHVAKANSNDFLFSENFKPGVIKLKPKKISDQWSSFRKKMKFSSEYQWYSLKDTGITNLLRAGVPLISVRDQARHHSSIQTDAYTPREILKANENIKTANIL